MSEKCNYCKKCKVDLSNQHNFANYCEECYKEITNKKQKHEKIEKMAWEIYQKMQLLKDKMEKDERDGYKDTFGISKIIDIAWIRAQEFYEFAKEKEEEVNE